MGRPPVLQQEQTCHVCGRGVQGKNPVDVLVRQKRKINGKVVYSCPAHDLTGELEYGYTRGNSKLIYRKNPKTVKGGVKVAIVKPAGY